MNPGRYIRQRRRLLLCVTLCALSIAACAPAVSTGSDPPPVGPGEVLFGFRLAGGVSARETTVYVWGDGSYAMYHRVSLDRMDEAELLATTPLKSGLLSEELLDRVHTVVGIAHRSGLQEGLVGPEYELMDAATRTYWLAGKRFIESHSPDAPNPLAAAAELVDAILAIEEVPLHDDRRILEPDG